MTLLFWNHTKVRRQCAFLIAIVHPHKRCIFNTRYKGISPQKCKVLMPACTAAVVALQISFLFTTSLHQMHLSEQPQISICSTHQAIQSILTLSWLFSQEHFRHWWHFRPLVLSRFAVLHLCQCTSDCLLSSSQVLCTIFSLANSEAMPMMTPNVSYRSCCTVIRFSREDPHTHTPQMFTIHKGLHPHRLHIHGVGGRGGRGGGGRRGSRQGRGTPYNFMEIHPTFRLTFLLSHSFL